MATNKENKLRLDLLCGQALKWFKWATLQETSETMYEAEKMHMK